MIEIIGIGGEPATGKTSLVKEILQSLGSPRDYNHKLVKGLMFPESQAIVFGVYGGDSIFEGTDRLSMAVQPIALNLISKMNNTASWHGWKIYFEGDRLFTGSLIEEVLTYKSPSRFYLLVASAAEKEARHTQRKDEQTERWIKSRQTKCANLLKQFPSSLRVLENNNYQDQARNLRIVMEEVSTASSRLIRDV